MKKIDGFRNEHYFLSNFYHSPLTFNGKHYLNVEAAFQAQKTLDEQEQWKFCNLSPRDARTRGRLVSLRNDWEDVKFDIMREILIQKFSNPELEKKLLETDDSDLIETNTWHDNCWGNCICEKCKNIPGKNMLGKTLMNIREHKKQEIDLYGGRYFLAK